MTRSRIDFLLCIAPGLLLAALLAVNLAAQSSLNPRAVALLLCLIAAAGLGRGRPEERFRSLFLILLFLAAAWNFAVNTSRRQGGFVHHHDAGHYYLGSRYFEELGYFGLYDGMTLALAELGMAEGIPEQIRDLRTKKLEKLDPAGQLAARRRFTPARWQEFRADVALVRRGLQADLAPFFQDHGYNATPLFTFVFRPLANAIPAGSAAGLALLAAIDPLLIGLSLALIAWAFGWRAGALGLTWLLLCFGALSGWTGGAYGRFLWWTLLVAGFCLLKRGPPLLAGAAIGLASLLQIFPALFLLPFAARALSGGRASAAWRLPAGAALSGLAAFAVATAGLGWGAWAQMLENLLAYLAVDAANAIGFRRVLATAGQLADAATGRTLSPVLGGVATLLSLLLAVGVLLAARRRDRAPSLLAAGAALIFLVFNLAGYYYVLLVLPLLALRASGSARQAFFGLEAACWLAQLLGLGTSAVFLWRSLLVGWLLLAPWLVRLADRRLSQRHWLPKTSSA